MADLSQRGDGFGNKSPTVFTAVNDYQAALDLLYVLWMAEFIKDLSHEKSRADQLTLIEIGIGLLLADLITAGHKSVPQAIKLAGIKKPSQDLRLFVEEDLTTLDKLLETSLVADLRRKLREDTLKGESIETITKTLGSFQGRVRSYAGGWWGLYNRAVGEHEGPVFWRIDPTVEKHCMTCLDFGNRLYDSFERLVKSTGGIWPAHNTNCLGNCRCLLEKR